MPILYSNIIKSTELATPSCLGCLGCRARFIVIMDSLVTELWVLYRFRRSKYCLRNFATFGAIT